MKYIQCPTEANPRNLEPTLFLAGGISNCPDWQSELTATLEDSNWTVLNPRRKDFDAGDSSLTVAQIDWEFRHLRLAGAIAFWFPAQTLCPIALYELGAWSMTNKPLFIGVDPNYRRLLDVKIQTQLVRPDVVILESLTDLASKIRGGIS